MYYIKYGNNIYELIHHRLLDRKLITTYHKVKTDDSFYMISDYYAKDYEIGDENIQDIYEIDFFVVYNDTSETVKEAAKYVYEGTRMPESSQRAIKEGIWCVNEGIPRYRAPILEENEVGLGLDQVSHSDDWVMDDRSSCSKIVNLYDCSGYIVRYTYSFKDGVQLPEAEVVEVKMEAEAFKEEMLKHSRRNV